jgi:hypothetical protein
MLSSNKLQSNDTVYQAVCGFLKYGIFSVNDIYKKIFIPMNGQFSFCSNSEKSLSIL